MKTKTNHIIVVVLNLQNEKGKLSSSSSSLVEPILTTQLTNNQCHQHSFIPCSHRLSCYFSTLVHILFGLAFVSSWTTKSVFFIMQAEQSQTTFRSSCSQICHLQILHNKNSVSKAELCFKGNVHRHNLNSKSSKINDQNP